MHNATNTTTSHSWFSFIKWFTFIIDSNYKMQSQTL
jgi:hypothetical protein